MKKIFVFLLTVLALIISSSRVQADIDTDSPKDQYIVVLKDNVSDVDSVSDQTSKLADTQAEHKFRRVMKGYTAKIAKNKVDKIRKDSRVAAVVEDKEVHASVELDRSHLPVRSPLPTHTPAPTRTPTPTRVPTPTRMPTPTRIPTPTNTPTPSPSQSTPTGFNRIKDILTASNKGSGIGVAVIDTGISLTHPDLQANIVADTTCVRNTSTGNDDNGHGTHVAGTIAAINNSQGVIGIAPEAKLIAVKVLNRSGSGTWSSIICGLDWAVTNASRYNIKVVNMSLGGTGNSDNNCGVTNSDPLHQAVCRARDAGLTVVVAAGNESKDVSNSVPAAYDDSVITVSALADSDGLTGGTGGRTSFNDTDDTFASFSNYGSTIDVTAPGEDILSTWIGNTYKKLSGTSMATPHVSGAAALYIKSHAGASWTQVRDALRSTGEALGAGHTDPSGKHSEPVVLVNTF